MNKETTHIYDLVQKLRDNGLGDLVDALYESKVYTRTGRLNKSAVGRGMGLTTKRVASALARAREVLGEQNFGD